MDRTEVPSITGRTVLNQKRILGKPAIQAIEDFRGELTQVERCKALIRERMWAVKFQGDVQDPRLQLGECLLDLHRVIRGGIDGSEEPAPLGGSNVLGVGFAFLANDSTKICFN